LYTKSEFFYEIINRESQVETLVKSIDSRLVSVTSYITL
jgi:hypothetical protein